MAGSGPVLASHFLDKADRAFVFHNLSPATDYLVRVVPVPCDPEEGAFGHRGLFKTAQGDPAEERSLGGSTGSPTSDSGLPPRRTATTTTTTLSSGTPAGGGGEQPDADMGGAGEPGMQSASTPSPCQLIICESSYIVRSIKPCGCSRERRPR